VYLQNGHFTYDWPHQATYVAVNRECVITLYLGLITPL